MLGALDVKEDLVLTCQAQKTGPAWPVQQVSSLLFPCLGGPSLLKTLCILQCSRQMLEQSSREMLLVLPQQAHKQRSAASSALSSPCKASGDSPVMQYFLRK